MTRATTRLALALLVALVAGCPNGERRDYAESPAWQGSTGDTQYEPVSEARDESLDAYIEETLMAELPPVDDTELGLAEMELERARLAEDMAGEVSRALAPAAVIAVLFVPEGPVDLLLSMTPARALGKAAKLGKDALKAKAQRPADQEAHRGVRASLASKMTGLLGERAAAEVVREAGFAHRYVGAGARFRKVERGVRHGRGSMDVVAYGTGGELVVAEVKNWSPVTWSSLSERNKILEHLRRHDEGLPDIMRASDRPVFRVSAKVLMVAQDGFLRGMDEGTRRGFVAAVKNLGWTIEEIPSDRIATFGELIDDLRR